jgi:hypothetical protein
MGRHNLVRDSALALLAYLLAFLSTHFLETPIREKRIAFFSTTRRSLLAGMGLLSLITLLSLALWTSARTHFRSELAPASLSCMQESGGTTLDGDGPCVLAQGRRAAIFLVGDSHANHWSPAVASWAGTAGARAIERSFAGCPVPWVSRHSIKEVRDAGDTDGCSAFSRLAMAEIEQTAASGTPTGVIVAADWQDLFEDSITAQPILAGNFDEALSAFERAGVRVLVIGPTPRFVHAIPACIARLDEHECRISRAQHEAATRAATAMLNAVVARHPRVRLWYPASHYCDARDCYPSRNGAPMFRDKELLSRRGAQTAVPDLAPVLDQLLPVRPRADH